jgi:hypothetical protein
MKVCILHTVDGLSAGQLDAESTFATSRDAHSAWLVELDGMKAALGNDARTVSADELRARRDAVDDRELELAQDSLDLHEQRLALLNNRKAELAALKTKTDADRDKAYADAAKALNRAGISVATVSNGGGPPIADFNGGSAEIVFGHRVRESATWRAANVAAVNAEAAYDACAAETRAAEVAVTKAEKQLAVVVARITGGTVSMPRPASWGPSGVFHDDDSEAA